MKGKKKRKLKSIMFCNQAKSCTKPDNSGTERRNKGLVVRICNLGLEDTGALQISSLLKAQKLS